MQLLTETVLTVQEVAELKAAAEATEQLAARATAQCAAAQRSARRAEAAQEAAISRAASADARTAAALSVVRSAQAQCPSLCPITSSGVTLAAAQSIKKQQDVHEGDCCLISRSQAPKTLQTQPKTSTPEGIQMQHFVRACKLYHTRRGQSACCMLC